MYDYMYVLNMQNYDFDEVMIKSHVKFVWYYFGPIGPSKRKIKTFLEQLTKLQCCQGCMKNSLWDNQGIARKVLKKLSAHHWLIGYVDLIILH